MYYLRNSRTRAILRGFAGPDDASAAIPAGEFHVWSIHREH